jgi:threonine synthase
MTDARATHESTMVCAGCGAEATGIYPFRCVRAHTGDDVDHVLTRVLDPEWVRFPDDGDANPFIRYRALLRSFHVGRAHGLTDDAYVALVGSFDEAVARVDGHGFRVTPFRRNDELSAGLGFSPCGGVWVKDETGNVSGSHKARHLAGIMIYLQVLERAGLVVPPLPVLAIASCGNAALAAAVVARAAARELHVFIPPDAPASVVARLQDLGAHVTVCHRQPGMAGDPCYHAFRKAVAEGALPFCCQGNENGLTIEGGETLGYEMVSALGGASLDRIVVQVGGGALASSVIQAFADAGALGATPAQPRFHAVQTRGAFPLKRAYDRVVERMTLGSETAQAALRYAVTHRSEFMWPWEQQPRSIAHGILDDETYDWFAVVKGMIDSGGTPVVVEEEDLETAYATANSTPAPLAERRTADSEQRGAIPVDHTGAAGLAGLQQLLRAGIVTSDERVAIIFSGAERRQPQAHIPGSSADGP